MIRYFLARGDRAGSAVIIEGLDSVSCSNPHAERGMSVTFTSEEAAALAAPDAPLARTGDFGGTGSTSRPNMRATQRCAMDSNGVPHPTTFSACRKNGASALRGGRCGTKRPGKLSMAANAVATIRYGFRQLLTEAPYSGYTTRII